LRAVVSDHDGLAIILHRPRQTQIKIDPYYRFILLSAQQAGVLNENEKVCDQLGLSLRKFHANLEEIPKRCWKKLHESLDAILHFTFLFCGVEAFSIALRYNVLASVQLPQKLENELNGLNRLVRKIVKRVLEDRDWKADILDVLREAQREAVLIFYILKSCPIPNQSTNDQGSSFIDAYMKGRVDQLIKLLDDISLTARSSSSFILQTLVDPADKLRTEMMAFSQR
jgi:hypothetical protein